MSAEQRIRELGIELTVPPKPMAAYVTFAQAGSMAYTSGHGPQRGDGSFVTGRLGEDLGAEEGKEAARLTALGLLATLRAELGSLDRVKRIVKVLGMVNSTPSFTDQPAVINGCSELLGAVFGEAGRHARSAVGVAALPAGMAVEIEVIIEVHPEPRPGDPSL